MLALESNTLDTRYKMPLKLCSCLAVPSVKLTNLKTPIQLNSFVMGCFDPDEKERLENLVHRLNNGENLNQLEIDLFHHLICQHNLFEVGLL